MHADEDNHTVSTDSESDESRPTSKFTKWRNIIGFWILGLTNNYPYVVMLSAAFDIIHQIGHDELSDSPHSGYKDSCTPVNGTYEGREQCEREGTSVSVCVCVCLLSMEEVLWLGKGYREGEREREREIAKYLEPTDYSSGRRFSHFLHQALCCLFHELHSILVCYDYETMPKCISCITAITYATCTNVGHAIRYWKTFICNGASE